MKIYSNLLLILLASVATLGRSAPSANDKVLQGVEASGRVTEYILSEAYNVLSSKDSSHEQLEQLNEKINLHANSLINVFDQIDQTDLSLQKQFLDQYDRELTGLIDGFNKGQEDRSFEVTAKILQEKALKGHPEGLLALSEILMVKIGLLAQIGFIAKASKAARDPSAFPSRQLSEEYLSGWWESLSESLDKLDALFPGLRKEMLPRELSVMSIHPEAHFIDEVFKPISFKLSNYKKSLAEHSSGTTVLRQDVVDLEENIFRLKKSINFVFTWSKQKVKEASVDLLLQEQPHIFYSARLREIDQQMSAIKGFDHCLALASGYIEVKAYSEVCDVKTFKALVNERLLLVQTLRDYSWYGLLLGNWVGLLQRKAAPSSFQEFSSLAGESYEWVYSLSDGEAFPRSGDVKEVIKNFFADENAWNKFEAGETDELLDLIKQHLKDLNFNPPSLISADDIVKSLGLMKLYRSFKENVLDPMERATPQVDRLSFVSGDPDSCPVSNDSQGLAKSRNQFSIEMAQIEPSFKSNKHSEHDGAFFNLSFVKPENQVTFDSEAKLASLYVNIAYQSYVKNIKSVSAVLEPDLIASDFESEFYGSYLGKLGQEIYGFESNFFQSLGSSKPVSDSSELLMISSELEQAVDTLLLLDKKLKNLDRVGIGKAFHTDYQFAQEEGQEGSLSRALSDAKRYLVQAYVENLCAKKYRDSKRGEYSKNCYRENFDRLMSAGMSDQFFLELFKKYGKMFGAGMYQEVVQNPEYQKLMSTMLGHAGQADELFEAEKQVLQYEIDKIYVQSKPLLLARTRGLSLASLDQLSGEQILRDYLSYEKEDFRKFIEMVQKGDSQKIIGSFAHNPGVADFLMQLAPRQKETLCLVQKRMARFDRVLEGVTRVSDLGVVALLPWAAHPAGGMGILGMTAVTASVSSWKTARIYKRLQDAEGQSAIFSDQLLESAVVNGFGYADNQRWQTKVETSYSAFRGVAFLTSAWSQASSLANGLTRLDKWTRYHAFRKNLLLKNPMPKQVFLNEGTGAWLSRLPGRSLRIYRSSERQMIFGPLIRRGLYEKMTLEHWRRAMGALFKGPNRVRAILPAVGRTAIEAAQLYAGPYRLFFEDPKEWTSWPYFLGIDMTALGAIAVSAKPLFEMGREVFIPILENYLDGIHDPVNLELVQELLDDAKKRKNTSLVERYEKYLQLEREGLRNEAVALFLLDRRITRDLEEHRQVVFSMLIDGHKESIRAAGEKWVELKELTKVELQKARDEGDHQAAAVLATFLNQVLSTDLSF